MKYKKKEVVLVSHKPVSKPHRYRGKASSFIMCDKDGSVQLVVKDSNV